MALSNRISLLKKLAAFAIVTGAAGFCFGLDLSEKHVMDVVSQMSPRAKNEIRITQENAGAFISDLKIVLADDKKLSGTDISLLTLVDKTHKLSSDYEPENLILLKANSLFNLNKDGMKIRPECYEALKQMSQAALDDGIRLLVSSVYRSYNYQKNLFDYWVRVDGLEEAERESARPGTSQHQTACAIDFGSISDDFDKTKMGQWVYSNAADYGFSLSFPKGYEDVTGYRWECWHFRYIGKNACLLQKKWFNNVQQYMLEFLYLLDN